LPIIHEGGLQVEENYESWLKKNKKYRIILYGAGIRGQRILKLLEQNPEHFDIVGVVDKNAGQLQQDGFEIFPIDFIDRSKYDYIFITIANTDIFCEVKDMLVKRGVKKKKIQRA
jgi:FlaA1/EpsC-like NDP-sugar epimerase